MHVNAVSEVVGFENPNTVVSPAIQSNSAVTPISYGNTSTVPVSGTQSGSNFIPVVVQDAVVSQDISIHNNGNDTQVDKEIESETRHGSIQSTGVSSLPGSFLSQESSPPFTLITSASSKHDSNSPFTQMSKCLCDGN